MYLLYSIIISSFLMVDSVLHANEFSYEFPEHKSVKSYDSNQLASNNPIEDTRSEASCIPTPGILMGIFDGHGGGACAQVVAKRIFKYISACLMSPDQLKEYLQLAETNEPMKLLKTYNDKVQFVEDVRDIYRNSFKLFVNDLIKDTNRSWTNVHEALEKAVLRLDDDISREALTTPSGGVNMKTLSVAMSGCVAIIAHINGPHLNIAHVGDACAVLGTQKENHWTATKLTVEHNIENAEEVERILGEHPTTESDTVLRMDRLLGQLAPLRSIGDFRYKWSKDIMQNVVVKVLGDQYLPPNYHTPPYLTAKPEVNYHKLTPNDKFLVIASDGLWDVISPAEVVNLVGKHMSGKVTLSPLFLPRRNMKLGEIEEVLQQRKESMKLKPKDKNAATHLIRNALGGTEFGIDHGKLSQMLSLPVEVSRVFRDDITVTVIYFDSDYLGHCPP
ncbi:pyruvate dehydrogenase [acetyl-transferring]-phosphatase 1, mitochondrial isoform X2 [Agrilus planipennis]|uniref:Pyruvate dehydrogenase [acetyl-transferring]-phosphatase 1, mitochondrial isoform X2 n=1 Tax=Agrilus planipennis TaxID=224129 RepID=A0A1W4X3Z8_AGRPL|nr:pyruvate dehydrogenase [acetyl-transferring]-phosphatase 1, mitochondrial isoform X2 [Agrilus planipennis]